jgi:hypothetical protein
MKQKLAPKLTVSSLDSLFSAFPFDFHSVHMAMAPS